MALTYELKHPVEHGKEDVTVLELKRPTAERMVKHKLSMNPDKMYDAETWYKFVCAYAHNVTEAVVKQLDSEDLQGAFEEVTTLF